MKSKKIKLKVSEGANLVAYLSLPKHLSQKNNRIVKKTISLHDIIEDYNGISVYLDFDESGDLIGIEIIE